MILSFWNATDETKVGNLLANAVDRGVNVVILLFSNCSSYHHPKGRFMAEKYNAMTRVACSGAGSSLRRVLIPDHPIMTNVSTLTLGSEKRRSMGKIPDGEEQHIDRVANWEDGNVLIAIRRNKPGLITEIACSFGSNGAPAGNLQNAKQLINNALRLRRKSKDLSIPMGLMNVCTSKIEHGEHSVCTICAKQRYRTLNVLHVVS